MVRMGRVDSLFVSSWSVTAARGVSAVGKPAPAREVSALAAELPEVPSRRGGILSDISPEARRAFEAIPAVAPQESRPGGKAIGEIPGESTGKKAASPAKPGDEDADDGVGSAKGRDLAAEADKEAAKADAEAEDDEAKRLLDKGGRKRGAERRLDEALAEKGRAENRDEARRGENRSDTAQVIRALSSRDAEVRAHEAAHVGAGGRYVRGGASFSYQRGPDGRMYAVGGEVGIDTSPVPGNPEATAAKMRTVRAAALAPADPSGADRSVAAAAAQQEAAALSELAQKRSVASVAAAPGGAASAKDATKPRGAYEVGNSIDTYA
ncbi:MAG: putative metalloprotease CJM1_0395 family protein [Spirochaetes bacterium]|nr:putative metalloprotease CJM1_0395 family protein [Spirochaetota bacterium]